VFDFQNWSLKNEPRETGRPVDMNHYAVLHSDPKTKPGFWIVNVSFNTIKLITQTKLQTVLAPLIIVFFLGGGGLLNDVFRISVDVALNDNDLWRMWKEMAIA
jgi:hypothetical protein